jgi:hypothetical protein
MFDTLDTTNKNLMGRYAVISTEALTSVKLVLANFSPSVSVTDTGSGAASTVTASIEYPAGTFTQVKFSAATSVSIADGNIAFSDYTTVSIPANTTFWVRQFVTNANGVCYFSGQNSFFSEATNAAPSGLSDQTMSGTITNSLAVGVPPLAVLGMTINPSVVIEGDSIGFGTNDIEDSSSTITGYNGKRGLITPSLGAIPFLNLSWPSKIAQFYTARSPARQQVLSKGSHLITQPVINDLDVNSRTPAQVVGDIQTIWSFARAGQKIFQMTCMPHASDPGTPAAAFTTTGQQSPINLSGHAGFNQLVRAGIAGATGFYDVASVFENTQDSDIIKPHMPAYTDGLHPTVTGYQLVPPSNVISPVTWP